MLNYTEKPQNTYFHFRENLYIAGHITRPSSRESSASVFLDFIWFTKYLGNGDDCKMCFGKREFGENRSGGKMCFTDGIGFYPLIWTVVLRLR